MKRFRDLLAIVLLFAVLIGFTVFGPARNQPDTQGQRGSTHSQADHGALGLQLWLRSLGYQADNLEYSEWQVPASANVIFSLATDRDNFTSEESDALLAWVQRGGTLISVLERPTSPVDPNPLWATLGASVAVSTTKDLQPAERADAAQPLFTTPPVTSVSVKTEKTILLSEPTDSNESGFVPLLETRYGPTLVGRQYERGYIFLGVSAEPFTNLGLREAGSGALMLNLLARAPRNGHVLFDEYHHGFRSVPSVTNVFTRSWWGWSIIYTLLVVLLFIILGGKRFGRPLVVREEVARRSSAEYVMSMAQLFQRAGKRPDIADHYRTMLKRRLAQPYGFVPVADDEQFLYDLTRWGNLPAEQQSRLQALLARLRTPRPSEADLVQFAQAIDAFVDRKGRIR